MALLAADDEADTPAPTQDATVAATAPAPARSPRPRTPATTSRPTPQFPATTRMESVSTDISSRTGAERTLHIPDVPAETVRVRTTYYATRIAHDAPIHLAFNFPRVLIAGYPSSFYVELRNSGGEVVEHVELFIESRGLATPVTERAQLRGGQALRLLAQIEPARHGSFVLQCTAKVTVGGQIKGYIGTRPLFINPAPKDVNQLVEPRNIRTNHASAEGQPHDPVLLSLHAIPGAAGVRTLDDLLKFKLPDQLLPMNLSQDYEVSLEAVEHTTTHQARHLIIYQLFLGYAQAGTLLKLTPIDVPKEPEFATVRPLHLVARPEFKIGRSRDPSYAADYITWFLPRNRANDEKTRHLGRVHVTLERRGGDLVMRDNDSVGGTTFDGQAVPTLGGEPLNRRAVLVLGGEYPLDVQPTPTAYPKGPEIKNISLWNGPQVPPPDCRGAVRFSPINMELAHHDAIWLFTDATYGTSRSNAIVVPLPGLAEIQGRFHHYRGCFWVENRIANQAVCINQRPLGGNEISPLMSGLTLQLGRVSFQVEVLA
jgi:hypothetical protein